MPNFYYRARDASGRAHEGIEVAATEDEVLRTLAGMQLTPVFIEARAVTTAGGEAPSGPLATFAAEASAVLRSFRQGVQPGSVALFEVLELNRGIRRMVLDGLNEDEIRKRALATGFMTLRKAGIRKILEGITTIDEVRAATLGDTD